MTKHTIHSTILLAGIMLASCIEPYQPRLSENYPDILVIDGGIDASHNKATVMLSHSMALDDTDGPALETAAQVTLEEQAGGTITLSEVETGRYEASLNIDYNKAYRLTIKTRGGKTYQSAYVPVQQTPALDSISWVPTADGVTVYANTHAAPGHPTSGYYQWNFIQSWEYTAYYFSTLVMKDGKIYQRPASEDIYRCWRTVPSTRIVIGTSRKLSADVIREFPLINVPKRSYQLSNTYTIIVEQRSITEEAYNYWLQLQKTTENVGGLFDPLPAQVTGNFTCLTDTDEPVLGYFAGSTVSEQRIFIHARDLPPYLQLNAPFPFCPVDSLPLQDGKLVHVGDNMPLIGSYGRVTIEGYTATTRECIDCTVQGGVTTKPDFWED